MNNPHLPLKTENTTVYIGLGSNLNNPLAQVQRALQALANLPETRLLKHSAVYRSVPLTLPDEEPSSQPDYFNAVAVLETRLPPLALLAELQRLEIQQGRIRNGKRWAPRPLDLDILLYGQNQSADPKLSLPHPGLAERPFVLYPLYECAADLILPDGRPLRQLLWWHCPPAGIQRC